MCIYKMVNDKVDLPKNPLAPPQKDPIRELCVKVHIRRSGKDSWSYLGRAFVTQEFIGHTSRVGKHMINHDKFSVKYTTRLSVVVRSAASGKIMVTFSEVRLLSSIAFSPPNLKLKRTRFLRLF